MSTFEQAPRDGTTTPGDDVKERAIDTVAEVDAGAMYVAGVAVDEAVDTARDAKEAARGFFEETRTQLADQAAVQQRRAADALRGTGDELEELTSGATSGGAATDAVRMIGRQTRRAADWLEQREPADVVGEVRRYARRHTVAFVVTAFAVGIVAGRVTRALVSDAHDTGGSRDGASRGRSGGMVATPASASGTVGGRRPSSATLGTQGGTVAGDTPIADALGQDARAGGTTTPGGPASTPLAGGADAGADRSGDAWSPSGGTRP
ncbi:hypothetical protein [Microbacterium kyungheense]|uniref:Uncharacterized protein n=1 Tax=Microbacterium kyungheense TaxID=1263636 RepID=A0A543FJJ1_9MICO|nr:hypothetical protein [Microbacterium kyungheense]TQM34011.1 hypothetical protein FB391_0298 [Microbacterium kyungheense]